MAIGQWILVVVTIIQQEDVLRSRELLLIIKVTVISIVLEVKKENEFECSLLTPLMIKEVRQPQSGLRRPDCGER